MVEDLVQNMVEDMATANISQDLCKHTLEDMVEDAEIVNVPFELCNIYA